MTTQKLNEIKDRHGRVLYKNDILRCVDPIEGFLTLHAEYRIEAIRPEESRVVIEPDDKNLEGWYASKRFELVMPSDEIW